MFLLYSPLYFYIAILRMKINFIRIKWKGNETKVSREQMRVAFRLKCQLRIFLFFFFVVVIAISVIIVVVVVGL